MAGSTYVIFCMEMQFYEKLKFLKNSEMLKSMSEHEILMSSLDKMIDEITYLNKSSNQSSTNISHCDSSEKSVRTKVVHVKTENVYTVSVVLVFLLW